MRTMAVTVEASRSLALVEELQARLVHSLRGIEDAEQGAETPAADEVYSSWETVEWLRDEGRHGGGLRFGVADSAHWNGASVNVSHVHYEDEPARTLQSATALSTILHPRSPHTPSMHMHVSHTSMKDGSGYWRVMADLNPAIPLESDRSRFAAALQRADPQGFAGALERGARYFWIPALARHRGVVHYYLEGYCSGDFDADLALARRVAETAIEHYTDIVRTRGLIDRAANDHERAAQRAYHTTYLFQVLTLDRGTTSGLLVHDQNDLGTLASLPARVDVHALRAILPRMPAPQDELLTRICSVLEAHDEGRVCAAARQKLAQVVRSHYQKHPGALAMQAAGDIVPPTLQNHGTLVR